MSRFADRMARSLQQAGYWMAANRLWLAYLAALSLLAFGFHLFGFSLSIDDENHAQLYGPRLNWVTQGRWGMYVLNALLLPAPVMPLLPTLIALSGTAAACTLFLRAMGDLDASAYAAAVLFVMSPVLFYSYTFASLGYGIGIGMLLAICGVLMVIRAKTAGDALWGVLPMMFAMAIYQAFALVIAAAFGLYLMRIFLSTSPDAIKRDGYALSFRAGVSFAVAVGLFFLSQQISYAVLGRESDGYVDGYIKLEWTAAYLSQASMRIAQDMMRYFLGSGDIYVSNVPALLVLFVLSMAVLVNRIMRRHHPMSLKLQAMGLLVAVVVVPFCFHGLNAGDMPPRAMLAIPVVLAGIVVLAMRQAGTVVRGCLWVLIVMCGWQFAVANNRLAMSNYMGWLSDRELTTRILDRVTEAMDASGAGDHDSIRLELVGKLDRQPSPIFVQRSTVGVSFYDWGEGDVRRLSNLIKTMGYRNYKPALPAQRAAVVAVAQKMPVWPRAGSVQWANGVVVIKLSEYTPQQLENINKGYTP